MEVNSSNRNFTFGIIKPDSIKQKTAGEILSQIYKSGFKPLAIKQVLLTKGQAEKFYSVHSGKPFFGELVDFMTSGPILVMLLQKENAVNEFRRLIGHTDPTKAEKGTIRNSYGDSIGKNAVHGSDSDENALIESAFFFSVIEMS